MSIDLAKLEAVARDIGHTIGGALPAGVGFALLIFDFGPSGNLTYLSNAQREDLIATLRECATTLESGLMRPPVEEIH